MNKLKREKKGIANYFLASLVKKTLQHLVYMYFDDNAKDSFIDLLYIHKNSLVAFIFLGDKLMMNLFFFFNKSDIILIYHSY